MYLWGDYSAIYSTEYTYSKIRKIRNAGIYIEQGISLIICSEETQIKYQSQFEYMLMF